MKNPAVYPLVATALLLALSQPAHAAQWYYCDSARAYYPYVSACPEGWRPVEAQSQQPVSRQAPAAVPTAASDETPAANPKPKAKAKKAPAPPPSAEQIDYDTARRLAGLSFSKSDAAALQELRNRAHDGDGNAAYGLGLYYEKRFQAHHVPATMMTPLIDEMLGKPQYNYHENGVRAAAADYMAEIHWWRAGANLGSAAAQAEFGRAWWAEASRYALTLSIIAERAGIQLSTSDVMEYRSDTRKGCQNARMWLSKALAHGDSPAVAQAYATLSLIYASDPQSGTLAKALLDNSGCTEGNIARSVEYRKRAGELGNSDAATVLAGLADEAGNIKEMEYWEERASVAISTEITIGLENREEIGLVECFAAKKPARSCLDESVARLRAAHPDWFSLAAQ
jgi:hypothetical protein